MANQNTSDNEKPKEENCSHNWIAINFDSISNDQIECTKCGLIETCKHGVGEFMENPSGCCFCVLCGHFTGLAH
jgi:hypothetical protein